MANLQDIIVPDVGEDEVEVIEVCVSAGDSVEQEDALVTVESDKASMDIPAPFTGTIGQISVQVGDKIKTGDLLGQMSAADNAKEPVAEQAEVAAEDAVAVDSAPAASQTIEVHVPDIGGDENVDIIEVLVNVGDTIAVEDGLITLETDKATMDVPAPQAGVVDALHVQVGDKVSEGSLVLTMTVVGTASTDAATNATTTTAVSAETATVTATAPQTAAIAAPVEKAPPVPHHPSAGDVKKTGKVFASPSVRRLAREFGVDLGLVNGSGNKGRIIKEDVQAYVKFELSRPKASATASAAGEGSLQVIAQPKVDFSKFGDVEEVPLTRIQKLSGPNLHRNWVTIPHVTQFEEADITDLEAFRKQQNEVAAKKKLNFKITPLVFMMKAVADALKHYPTFNASLSADGESLIMKKYFHIGIAVDTPNGLVVPVVRDVDQKGIYELSEELMDISIKARDGKLKAADMQGSCFTISSLGGIGGTAFTPIVNAPDVAILGVSKSEIKPVWDGQEFAPRLMLPLSLSYDHRVIDGALAARFAVHLKTVLSDLRNMLL